MKKFELLTDAQTPIGMFRIRALISFGDVSAGDVGGFVQKEENLSTFDNARVSGDAQVYGDAEILWFTKVGSEFGTLTAYKSKDGIAVNRGCFNGTLDEFSEAVEKKHGTSKVGEEYRLLIQVIRLRLS